MSHLAIIPDDAPSYVREEEITTSRNPYDDQIQELIHKPDITAGNKISFISFFLSFFFQQCQFKVKQQFFLLKLNQLFK